MSLHARWLCRVQKSTFQSIPCILWLQSFCPIFCWNVPWSLGWVSIRMCHLGLCTQLSPVFSIHHYLWRLSDQVWEHTLCTKIYRRKHSYLEGSLTTRSSSNTSIPQSSSVFVHCQPCTCSAFQWLAWATCLVHLLWFRLLKSPPYVGALSKNSRKKFVLMLSKCQTRWLGPMIDSSLYADDLSFIKLTKEQKGVKLRSVFCNISWFLSWFHAWNQGVVSPMGTAQATSFLGSPLQKEVLLTGQVGVRICRCLSWGTLVTASVVHFVAQWMLTSREEAPRSILCSVFGDLMN